MFFTCTAIRVLSSHVASPSITQASSHSSTNPQPHGPSNPFAQRQHPNHDGPKSADVRLDHHLPLPPLDKMANHVSLFQHQPRDHPRHDASLEKDPLRRPPSPHGRPRALRRLEHRHRRHVPLPAAENQPEER